MRYSYHVLYYLRGMMLDPSCPPVSILGDLRGGVRAVFAAPATPEFEPVDMHVAIADEWLDRRLRGVTNGNTFEAGVRLRADRFRQQRSESFIGGTYLLITATGEESCNPNIQPEKFEGFSVLLEAFRPGAISTKHKNEIIRILGSVVVSLSSVSGIKEVGHALVGDSDDGKPIYCLQFVLSAKASVSKNATRSELDAAKAFAVRAWSKRDLSRVFDLLNQSLDLDQSDLLRFLSAWTGLEVFVNKVFDNYDNKELCSVDETGRRKLPIVEKFRGIATTLDPHGAEGDVSLFQAAKKQRDLFLHTGDVNERSLPIGSLRQLIGKYLRLHLNSAVIIDSADEAGA